ncbi:uncharacterized protein LOC127862097 [Dreissena polymorpha]|uniref:uncharacterized protein LOC127862097 n=1 Tax=Dreissena polymorpha TaxID=45954 RepID=UPI0022655FA5|nr:uncharacterized protein LOC127862097 [Dreissena polymorpha]
MNMLWGDLEIKQATDGTRYIEYTERATKTRKGVTDDERMFKPKIFEQPGDERCPVKLYLEYESRRPLTCLRPDSRFYLRPNYKAQSDGGCWFVGQPIRKNTLCQIAKTMSASAGFTGRHVNHSGRKTLVTSLLNAGCATT